MFFSHRQVQASLILLEVDFASLRGMERWAQGVCWGTGESPSRSRQWQVLEISTSKSIRSMTIPALGRLCLSVDCHWSWTGIGTGAEAITLVIWDVLDDDAEAYEDNYKSEVDTDSDGNGAHGGEWGPCGKHGRSTWRGICLGWIRGRQRTWKGVLQGIFSRCALERFPNLFLSVLDPVQFHFPCYWYLW